jgi:predicted HicB family RNase H-like nuclease
MLNGGDMSRSKSSISKAQSYQEIGEFWDTHDLDEYWEQTDPAEFDVNIQSEMTYYRVDSQLSAKINLVAKQRGVSPETLLNLWVQEKLQETVA